MSEIPTVSILVLELSGHIRETMSNFLYLFNLNKRNKVPALPLATVGMSKPCFKGLGFAVLV